MTDEDKKLLEDLEKDVPLGRIIACVIVMMVLVAMIPFMGSLWPVIGASAAFVLAGWLIWSVTP